MVCRSWPSISVLASLTGLTGVAAMPFAATAQHLDVDFPLLGPILVPIPLGPGSTISIPQYPRPTDFGGARAFNLSISISAAAHNSILVSRPIDAGPVVFSGAELCQRIMIEPPGFDASLATVGSGLDQPLYVDLFAYTESFSLAAGESRWLSFPASSASGSISWHNSATLDYFDGIFAADLPLAVSTQFTLPSDDGLTQFTFLGSGVTIDGSVRYTFSTLPTPGASALLALGGAWLSRRRRGA